MAGYSITRLDGDGIGSPHLNGSWPGQLSEKMLPAALDKAVQAINDVVAPEDRLELLPFDLSSDARMQHQAPHFLKDYYEGMVGAVMGTDGRFLKMPTTTPTEQQVRAYIAANHEEFDHMTQNQIDAFVRLQMHSPNDALRRGLDLQVMERPFYADDEISFAPKKIAKMEVFAPQVDEFLGEHDGVLSREISDEALSQYAYELLERAVSEGKEVLVTTKHTISQLDSRFLAAISKMAGTRLFQDKVLVLDSPAKNALAAACREQGKVIVAPRLFDSFLPAILQNVHEGKIIACLPDQAAMLEGLVSISGQDLQGQSIDMPPRVVCRVPKGSGYGEELFERSGVVGETHTLPEADIVRTAKRAFELAEVNSTRPILVLAVGENAVDEKVERIVADAIGAESFDVMTLSEVMKALAENPNAATLRVFITTNQLGDYLSDLLPQLHYGSLGAKALGAGENLNFSFTDSGALSVVGADPSTGTAPALANTENAHLILPAGALLSLASLLIEDYRLPEGLNTIGQVLRSSVLTVLTRYSGVDDHSDFVRDVIANMMISLDDSDANVGRPVIESLDENLSVG